MKHNLVSTWSYGTRPSLDCDSRESDHIAVILDGYLIGLERGESTTPEELLARHPDIADRLRAYLSGLALFQGPATLIMPKEIAADGAAPLSGQLGDFRIVREIARGGMGIVYEAVQNSLERRVALKVLPFSAAIDDKQLIRFKNEAQAAAQIDHPNIVPVFAVGEERGIHYFAMQLIGGQSVGQLLGSWRSTTETMVSTRQELRTKRTTREVQERAQILAQLGIQAAEALHAAHEIGVVHRDIKPSNLLLDERGKLWVTDFGVARCKGDSHLTQTGHLLGTMPYMSPEQARGEVSLVDHRTDIYSLGVTLYELISLRHPFEELSDRTLASEAGRASLRSPRYWNRAIPADLAIIVLKAMSDSREDRYATAKEFADDLRRFTDGEQILAQWPSLATRLNKWSRRNQKAMLAACGVLSLAVAGLAGSLILISAERKEKDEALLAATANHSRAEQNYRQARETFRQARKMLDRFGARVNEGLASSVPGAEGVRKELLAEMLPYYEQFAREAAGDPSLQADLAMTYSKIGYLSDQLGSLAEAEKAYVRAIEVLERISSANLNGAEHQRSLAACLNNLGQVQQRRGSIAAARAQLARARQIQERLISQSLDDAGLQADLATTCSNFGLLESQGGAKAEAAAQFRKAIAIQEPLVQASPENVSIVAGLAASYNNLSSIYLDRQPEQAQQWIERALALQLRLVRAQPKQRSYQSELALSYSNLGTILARQKQWEPAQRCFHDATTIQQRLVKVAPLVASHRRDLAISFNNLGMTQSSAGKPAEAQASFARALELQQELALAYPHDVNLLSSLGGIYNNLGMAHRSRQQWAEATVALEQAIDAQQKAYERAPNVPAFRDSLSKHYFNHAQVLRRQSRPADAADVVLKRRELWAGNPTRLAQIAGELAAICKDLPLGATREKYVAQVSTTLEAARAAGLKSTLDLTSSPLDVLSEDAGAPEVILHRGGAAIVQQGVQ